MERCLACEAVVSREIARLKTYLFLRSAVPNEKAYWSAVHLFPAKDVERRR
jgi:hypothetical protein